MRAQNPIHSTIAAAVLLCSVHAAAGQLWFVRVSATDGYGNEAFYSFLPSKPASVRSPVRRNAWVNAVADVVSVQPRTVILLDTARTFPFKQDRFFPFSPGMRGISIVHGRDGSVRTNALEVADDGKIRPVDSVEGLFPLRGAGRDIWFVSDDDLSNRWRNAKAATIRREYAELEENWRNDPSVDGKARLAWLLAWRNDRSDLWPKLVFKNRTGENASIRFGQESKQLAPGESWTISFKEKPDANYFKEWTYLVSGQNEEDLVPCQPIDWSPTSETDIPVYLDKRKFRSENPTFDIRTLFPEGFDPEVARLDPSAVSVEVRYEGEDSRFRSLRPADAWIREVEPRRAIRAVRIPSCDFFEAIDDNLWTDRKEYPHGPGTVRLVRHPKGSGTARAELSFKPWPGLAVSNSLVDRPVAVKAVYFNPMEEPWSSDPIDLDPAGPSVSIQAPPPEFAPNSSRIEVLIRASAEKAEFVDKPIFVTRGETVPVVVPEASKVESFGTTPYPRLEDRWKVGSNVFSILSSMSLSQTLGGAPKDPNNLFNGPTGNTIRALPAHRKGCRMANCPDCRHLDAQLKRLGRPVGDPSEVDAALVCALEFQEGKRKLSGANLEAKLDQARKLLGPFRRKDEPEDSP